MVAHQQAPQVFWVSNISNRNVNLTDLGLTIPAGKHANLLDKRHYNYTYEELIKSATCGSIFKKRTKIVVRKVPPKPDNQYQKKMIDHNAVLPSRRRSLVKVIEKQYDELEITDDEFAIDNADLVDR